jgi:ribosomal protein S18 acetylase RimI-like enzyme
MATNGMEETGVLETDAVLVRTMRQDDLNAIVAIDAAASGRRRPRYFELMLQRSITQARLQISLVAEVDSRVVGFVIGSLYYGEYGVAEPSASIDAISVDSKVREKNIGKALMRQLRLNLGALRITILRTEVSWDHFGLLGFFRSQGFRLSSRLCLECALDPTRPEDSAAG